MVPILPTLILVLAAAGGPRGVPAARFTPRSYARLFVSQLAEEPSIFDPPKAFAAMDANAADVETFLASLARGRSAADEETRPARLVVYRDGRISTEAVRVRVHRCRGPVCLECGSFQVRRLG